MASWQTGYVTSGAERIYWELAGSGVPVVICHGAGSNHVSFYQQVATLAGEDVQLLLWDQRGYGNSSRSTSEVDVRAAAADLDAVLGHVGLADTPLHLIGQAMGGLVAGTWAIDHPGSTLSIALWDGPFGLSADGARLEWTLEPGDLGVAGTLVDRVVSQTRAVGPAFREIDPVRTYLYQTIQELGPKKPNYQVNFAAAKAAPLALDALNALGVPVLFGRGELDHTVNDAALDALAARVPSSVRVTLAGCGHSPYFELPDVWNAAVRAHMARVPQT